MNEREAKYWALRKWRLINKLVIDEVSEDMNTLEDIVTETIPELNEFSSNCSYCSIHYKTELNRCGKCPLVIGTLDCSKRDHPYYECNFYEMLTLIRNIPVSRDKLFFRKFFRK